MKYLLGVDFGGGSSKATLLCENGTIAAENSVEYPTYYPQLGFCEQKPEDWIAAMGQNTRQLLEKSGISPSDIAAVAIDSATHTAVLCDENSRVLRPAIHWTDSRSLAQAKALSAAAGEEIFRQSYHRPDTIWTLPQLCWVRENEPEIFAKIGRIFFEKDYIRYALTGTFCTDTIEAQGSMLFDCRKNEWSQELCRLAGISPRVLPPLCRPTDQIGEITGQAAALTGLLAGTPVICGSTDTVMEVFASAAVEPGDVTVKLATAGRICVLTDRPYPNRHLVNYSHIVNGLWYPGTATKAAASSYRWYRDTFGGNYEELNRGAESVALGCEGLMYHPYLNGELTPYADPLLCGSFTGIRATHTRGHFTRAVLEGVAFSLLHSKKTLEEIGISCGKTATIIGGGAKGKLWRQITADCLGMSLRLTESSDSSLGSAMLAGVAIGIFKDPKQAAQTCIHTVSVTEPNEENHEAYAERFREYVRIHDALAPIYDARGKV